MKVGRGLRSRLATRRKLVDAAKSVMAEKGVEATSIADITEAADVGFGSFYNHFKSKQELAAEILEIGAGKVIELTGRITERERDSAYCFAFVCRLFVEESLVDPVWGRFLIRTRAILPQVGDLFASNAKAIIREGLASGRFTMPYVDTLALILAGTLNAVVAARLDARAEPAAEFEAIECLLRMIGVEPDEAKAIVRVPLPDYLADSEPFTSSNQHRASVTAKP